MKNRPRLAAVNGSQAWLYRSISAAARAWPEAPLGASAIIRRTQNIIIGEAASHQVSAASRISVKSRHGRSI